MRTDEEEEEEEVSEGGEEEEEEEAEKVGNTRSGRVPGLCPALKPKAGQKPRSRKRPNLAGALMVRHRLQGEININYRIPELPTGKCGPSTYYPLTIP